MDWKIELVAIPVTDVDRAKTFYVEQVGFNADHDYQVSDELRFVQLTPPGSACSVVMGTGITQMPPGSQKGVQVVVADVEAARQDLLAHGVQASLMATPGRSSSCQRGRSRVPRPRPGQGRASGIIRLRPAHGRISAPAPSGQPALIFPGPSGEQ